MLRRVAEEQLQASREVRDLTEQRAQQLHRAPIALRDMLEEPRGSCEPTGNGTSPGC
jgi:hypothetical protein